MARRGVPSATCSLIGCATLGLAWLAFGCGKSRGCRDGGGRCARCRGRCGRSAWGHGRGRLGIRCKRAAAAAREVRERGRWERDGVEAVSPDVGPLEVVVDTGDADKSRIVRLLCAAA